MKKCEGSKDWWRLELEGGQYSYGDKLGHLHMYISKVVQDRISVSLTWHATEDEARDDVEDA